MKIELNEPRNLIQICMLELADVFRYENNVYMITEMITENSTDDFGYLNLDNGFFVEFGHNDLVEPINVKLVIDDQDDQKFPPNYESEYDDWQYPDSSMIHRMKRVSSDLGGAEFDLIVEFIGEGKGRSSTHQYHNVDMITIKEFFNANSVGKYFHAYIKGEYNTTRLN